MVHPAKDTNNSQLDWTAISELTASIAEETRNRRRPEAVREYVRQMLAALNGYGITDCGPRHRLALDPLTKREMEFLALSSQGETNKDMALALLLSETVIALTAKTVNYKLGSVNRTSAVATAFRLGVLA